MGAVGTETTPDSSVKSYRGLAGGAKSGATTPIASSELTELAELIALWPHLPAPVRKALIQLARVSRPSPT